MKHETAGDPMTGLKWTRRTTAKVASELQLLGMEVSANTVARLLKKMGFSLRVNHKKKSNGSPKNRDSQFVHIGDLRQQFATAGKPIISARENLIPDRSLRAQSCVRPDLGPV